MMVQPVKAEVSKSEDVNGTVSDSCPICESGSPQFLCLTNNSHSSTKLISHYRCASCGLVFVGNKFDDEELGEAYGGLDSTEYYSEIRTENLRKMDLAAKRLKELLKKQDRIIDIGTGDGSFIRVLSEAGFEDLSCHEIPGTDLTAIASIAKSVYSDYDYGSIPSASFDAVTMLDVLEHVRDPRSLLENCLRILKPGGIVYFHTPVVTRTDRLMHFFSRLPVLGGVGRTWQAGRTSIFHLRNYTLSSLNILLKRAGFENADIKLKNELSWPVSRYVRIFLVDKFGLPRFLTSIVSPLIYPLLATRIFNANKSIVAARRPEI